MSNEQPGQPEPQSDQNTKSRFFNRDVLGVACLSIATVFAVILLVWACVSRGNCKHWGPDTCASRMNLPSLERHHHHILGGRHEHQPPPPPPPPPPPQPDHDEHQTLPGFEGNADFYGLGIRLGIYLQWMASLIANAVLDDNIRQITTAPYVGFQIAVLAALLLLVFRPDCTFTAEVMVIIYILLGGVFIVLAPEIVQSFRHIQWEDENRPKYRLFSTFVWILVGLVVPVSAWFWIRLASVDTKKGDFYHTPGPEGTSMFFVGHITGRGIGIASVFMAIWSLVLGLFALEKVALASLYRALQVEIRPSIFVLLDVFFYVVSTTFVLFDAAIRHIINSCQENSTKPLCEVFHDALKQRRDVALGDVARNATTCCTRLYAFALALFSIIMSICSVEMTLTWNHVTDVNSVWSTGQIVPLFVGLATLGSVIWELVKKAKANPKTKVRDPPVETQDAPVAPKEEPVTVPKDAEIV